MTPDRTYEGAVDPEEDPRQEEPLEESPQEEQPLDEQPLDEQPLDEQPLEEQAEEQHEADPPLEEPLSGDELEPLPEGEFLEAYALPEETTQESPQDSAESQVQEEELYVVEGLEEEAEDPGAGGMDAGSEDSAGEFTDEGDESGIGVDMPEGMAGNQDAAAEGEAFAESTGEGELGDEAVGVGAESSPGMQRGGRRGESGDFSLMEEGEVPADDIVNVSTSGEMAVPDSSVLPGASASQSAARAASREFRERAARAAASRVGRTAASGEFPRAAIQAPVSAPPRRRRGWLLPVGLAAAVLIGAALVLLQGESNESGEQDGSGIARTDIIRPSVTFVAPPPVVAIADEPKVAVEPGDKTDVEKREEPTGEEPVLASRPGPERVAIGETEPRVAARPLPPEVSAEIGKALDEVLASIPQPAKPAPGGGATEPATIYQNLPRGTQALAQLHNGNFFIGSVKRIETAMVTLNLPGGEVTFHHVDLKRLMPLASADFRTLSQGIAHGSVVLKNTNRLVGQILRDQEGHVIVDLETAKITIPRDIIEEVSTKPPADIGFGAEDEEAWFRKEYESGKPASRKGSAPMKEGKEGPAVRVIVDPSERER
jgi:hypothetical protein